MAETALVAQAPAHPGRSAPVSDISKRGSPNPVGTMESFVYDDAIVRKFLTATVVWGIVAFLAGVIVALELVVPSVINYTTASGTRPFAFLSFLTNIQFLTFGRLRPLHTNAAIFAFAGNSIFAGIYYSTQRLCKARMWSDTLSSLHFWGWQLIIVCAALTLPMGFTQGKEYAELEWPIDILIAIAWLGFFGTNFFMTLKVRRERHMYVALWFYIATIVTVTMLHVLNSLAIPAGWLKSYSVYAGVQDAMMQWWYGHNAVAFFLTTPFLGLMYYFMPKAAERPVYSYRLSIVHFWSLIFIYIWAGPHHLHYTALPAWASTLGMLFSVMLWMPSWGGGINGLLTLRGAWHKLTDDPVLKFFVVGVTFYMMSTFEGPMMSVKTVNMLSHYTDWTIAHVHGGALGWNGFMTFGMIYWLAPRLFQAPLHSKKLATTHFWLGTLGILMYIIPIYVAGITQGLMWRAFDETGNLKFPDFVETVAKLMPFYWIRVGGGLLFLTGALLMAYNLVRTWMARPARYEEPVQSAPALYATPSHDERPRFVPALTSNTDAGRKGDVVLQSFFNGWWHRVWEGTPYKFIIWAIIAVASGSALEIIPMFAVRSNVPSIASVQPYTPLELCGRDVYVAEGCYNCHSQMIRPIWAETKRYGEYSKPGEFVYDHPFQWGSRRIGPDLAREGGMRSNLWHVLHLQDPRQSITQSIMPSYAHLLDAPIDFDEIQAHVRAQAMIGVPYGEDVKEGVSQKLARAQAQTIADNIAKDNGPKGLEDKKIVALIAYLQRLGTDISKPPPAPAPATADAKPDKAAVSSASAGTH
ncbi:MAG TPA: cytochrome-c oxidase, cbb3-type subunit I [Phycisphaerales bacterium]|nr:cytochrome-c oxidase, cbb3-type subunit I [Phycisphaerales bacterium]